MSGAERFSWCFQEHEKATKNHICPLGIIVDFGIVGFSFRDIVGFIKHLAEQIWGFNTKEPFHGLCEMEVWFGEGWDPGADFCPFGFGKPAFVGGVRGVEDECVGEGVGEGGGVHREAGSVDDIFDYAAAGENPFMGRQHFAPEGGEGGGAEGGVLGIWWRVLRFNGGLIFLVV